MKTGKSLVQCVLIGLLAAMLVFWPTADAARGQAKASDADTGSVELDMQTIMLSPEVDAGMAQGFIWSVAPQDNSMVLLQILLIVKPGDKEFVLDRSTVRLRGRRARFLTFRFPEDVEEEDLDQMNVGRGTSAGTQIRGGLDRRNAAYGQLTGGGSAIDRSRDTGAARRMLGGAAPRSPTGIVRRGVPSAGTRGRGAQLAGTRGRGAQLGGIRGATSRGRPMTSGLGGLTGLPTVGDPYDELREPPRFASKLTITPRSKVKWALERRIQGGELQDTGQLYPLLMNSQLLNAQNPNAVQSQQMGGPAGRGTSARGSSSRRGSSSGGNMPTGRGMPGGMPGGAGRGMPGGTRGGTGRAMPGRSGAGSARLEAAQRKMAMENFRKLQKEVRALPKKFEADLPERIWAVFQVDMLEKDLNLQCGRFPSLNWKLSFDQFQVLQYVASQGLEPQYDYEDNAQFSPEQQACLFQLGELAKDESVPSRRAVAQVLHLARMGAYTEIGSPLYLLFQTLLESDDPQTRRMARDELVQTVPYNRATISLLKMVAKMSFADSDVGEKANILKAIMAGAIPTLANDPSGGMEVAARVNQDLADPKGPSPRDVLTSLIEQSRLYPEAAPVLADSIQFRRVTGDRLQEVLVCIVEHAGTDPLAAQWLDQQFLSSTSADMVRRSLQVIADADVGAQSVGSMMQWGITKVLGAPARDTAGVKAKIVEKIPIHTVQHGMVRSLRHGDNKIRDLAWRALPQFKLPPMYDFEAEFQQQGDVGQTQDDRYEVIISAALDQSPTPTQIVPFLADQPQIIVKEATEMRDNPQSAYGAMQGGYGRADLRGGDAAARAMGRADPAARAMARGAPRSPASRSRNTTARRGSVRGTRAGAAVGMAPIGPGSMGPAGFPSRSRGAAARPGVRPGGMQPPRGARRPGGATARPTDPSQHPDILKAVGGLVQIVISGSKDASEAAARALKGSEEWPIAEALMELGFGEREGFAMRTYTAFPSIDGTQTLKAPLVTSVMRQRSDRNPVVAWFGKQLASDTLPDPSRWVEAFGGGEEEVLTLTVVSDRELAKGAVAVLVSSAGGDDRTARQFADELRAMKGSDVEKVKKAWDDKRRELFTRKVTEVQGPYRLLLRIGPESAEATRRAQEAATAAMAKARGGPPGGMGGPGGMASGPPPGMQRPAMPRPGIPGYRGATQEEQPVEFEQEIDLGIIHLKVDGDRVSFGNDNLAVSIHKSKAAISILKPSDFKNFENEDVAKLELDNVDYAVDMKLQPDGSWKGVFNTAPEVKRGGRGAGRRGAQGQAGGAKGVYVFLEKATAE